MWITTLTQTAKGLPQDAGEYLPTLREDTLRELERVKWFLWHGNVYQALLVLGSVESNAESAAIEGDHASAHKLAKALREFVIYIKNNQSFIPNYGERYRNGERISTGFVESTVNYVVSKRMVKKQQMKWSQRGAHLLLQIRTRVLNGKWEEAFRRWYPGFRTQRQPALA
jgi:hypothetical protein